MSDYADDYRVLVRRTDDLQFPFERLALHWSHISPDLGFSYLIRSLMWANGGSSRRNARYRGCVCVDRVLSWCFVLSLEWVLGQLQSLG